MHLDLFELAWAAGFYDGEGSTITDINLGAGRVTLQVTVTQVDRQVLDRFRAAVGGLGNVYGPFDRPNPKHRPLYTYRVNRFEHSQAVLAMLWRFLDEVKRDQAVGALRKYHENRRPRFRFAEGDACQRGHQRERWIWTGGRLRCLECRREDRYQKLGRPVPPLSATVGRARKSRRTCLTSQSCGAAEGSTSVK